MYQLTIAMGQVLIGLAIFILSQYFLKLHLNPYKEFCNIRSEISYLSISNYGNLIGELGTHNKLADKLNDVSARLLTKYNSIWFSQIFERWNKYKLPTQKEVKTASQKLNIIASKLRKSDRESIEINDSLREIKRILKIDINTGH